MMEDNTNAVEKQEGVPKANPQEPKADPQMEQKAKAYVEGLSRLLHSKSTKEQVYGMLQAGDPMQTIPQTALAINEQMERGFEKKGRKVDVDVLVAGAQYLVVDLVKIGEAGNFFDIDEEDENVMGNLLTSTMQPWIEQKIKEDPNFAVELQEAVNPMIDKQKGQALNKFGGTQGLSSEAGISQAMQVNRQQGVLEGQAATEKKAGAAVRNQSGSSVLQVERGVQ